MTTFLDLAASRRQWIEEVLRPWCMHARSAELHRAEQEWLDVAGRISPDFSLWMWAWSRYPGLVIADLWRIDEAVELQIELADGRAVTGFADTRQSHQDLLVVLVTADRSSITINLDDIRSLTVLRPIEPVPDRALTPSITD